MHLHCHLFQLCRLFHTLIPLRSCLHSWSQLNLREGFGAAEGIRLRKPGKGGAFQGNSFTPCLQTICYCSRRRWRGPPQPSVGPSEPSTERRRAAAGSQPTRGVERQAGEALQGRAERGRHQRLMQMVGTMVGGRCSTGASQRLELAGNARQAAPSHQKHPFLTYSKSQGHTRASQAKFGPTSLWSLGKLVAQTSSY